MHSTERRMLVSSMSGESGYSFGATMISSIIVALLALMAVGGALKYATAPQPGSPANFASDAILPSAAAHRKAVFDDRRARFMGTAAQPGVSVLAASATIALARTPAGESISEADCSGGADGGMAATGNQCSE